MLQKAHVPGPYLLVAHSYGGMIARRFTQLHPGSVAGIVFVDAFSPAIKPLFGDLWTQYEESSTTRASPSTRTRRGRRSTSTRRSPPSTAGPALPDIPIAVLSKTEPFGTAPTVRRR